MASYFEHQDLHTSIPEPQEMHKRAADSAKETRSTLITLTTAAVGGLVFIATREFKPTLTTLEKNFVLLTIVLMVGSLGAAIWCAYSDAQWSYHWGAELDGRRSQKAVDAAGEGILLIFDNAIDADALKPYLPRGGIVNVLVTSNAPAWRGVAEPVEIRLWPKEIGADYLIARTGRQAERSAAEALSQVLGGLPLAHEQTAAYCERLGVSLAAFHRRFEAVAGQLMDSSRDAPREYHDRLTVAKTFALAIEEAAKLHPAAEPLIVHAALLAPEPVPLFLFSEAREKFSEPLATALTGDGLDEVVAVLRGFALVERETIVDERDASITTDAIRLHRLVREIAAARREGEARDTLRQILVEAVGAVWPHDSGYPAPAYWPRCGLLTPHLLACCETEMADAATNADCARNLHRAGLYFHSRATYLAARPLLERALAIYEQVLGPEHPETASSLHNLALLLQAQGDLAGARPLFERALAIDEVLGPEHPYTATSLANLALLLQDQGDLTAAVPLCERALAIREKVLGPEHPHTANSLASLALLLWDQGDVAAARQLLKRALAVREQVLGPEHPDRPNDLALLLWHLGDLAAARPLYERALAIREQVLGPEHPDTARSLNSLGSLLQEQGDLAGARPLLERALAIREKVLGPEHPRTATSLNDLASLLKAQGDCGSTAALRARAGDSREGTRPRESRFSNQPQRSRQPASSPGRPCGSTAALRARAGDSREGTRPRASRYGDEPQLPRRPASKSRRPYGGAAALRARAGYLREGVRPRASQYGVQPPHARPSPGRPYGGAAAL
jgi:tetratricopeptide (TPR) repeat protein